MAGPAMASEPTPSRPVMQHHGSSGSDASCCLQLDALGCDTSSAAEGNAHSSAEWSQLVQPFVAVFIYLVFDVLRPPDKGIPPHREQLLERLAPIFLLTQRLRI